jgi:hypothetical protein
MDCGVRRGRRRELNAGEALVRVFREMRARISSRHRSQHWRATPYEFHHHTFLISVKDIVVCITKSKVVGDWWQLEISPVKTPPKLVIRQLLEKLSLRLDSSTYSQSVSPRAQISDINTYLAPRDSSLVNASHWRQSPAWSSTCPSSDLHLSPQSHRWQQYKLSNGSCLPS